MALRTSLVFLIMMSFVIINFGIFSLYFRDEVDTGSFYNLKSSSAEKLVKKDNQISSSTSRTLIPKPVIFKESSSPSRSRVIEVIPSPEPIQPQYDLYSSDFSYPYDDSMDTDAILCYNFFDLLEGRPLVLEEVSEETLLKQYSKPHNYVYYNCTRTLYDDKIGEIWNQHDTLGHFHIQKAAGSTLGSMVGDFCCEDTTQAPLCSSFKTRVPTKCLTKHINLSSGCLYHPTLPQFYDCLGRRSSSLVYVGIFRNPVDRLISEFYHLKGSAKAFPSGLWRVSGQEMRDMADGTMTLEDFMRRPNLFTNRMSRALLEAVWESTPPAYGNRKQWYDFQNRFFDGDNSEFEKDFNTNPNYIGMLKDIVNSQFLWVGTPDRGLWNASVALFNKKFDSNIQNPPKKLNHQVPDDIEEIPQDILDLIAERNHLDMLLCEFIYERIEREMELLDL